MTTSSELYESVIRCSDNKTLIFCFDFPVLTRGVSLLIVLKKQFSRKNMIVNSKVIQEGIIVMCDSAQIYST